MKNLLPVAAALIAALVVAELAVRFFVPQLAVLSAPGGRPGRFEPFNEAGNALVASELVKWLPGKL